MIVCVLFYYHKALFTNFHGGRAIYGMLGDASQEMLLVRRLPTGQCGSEKAVTKDLRQRLEGPRFGWRDRPSCDLRVVD